MSRHSSLVLFRLHGIGGFGPVEREVEIGSAAAADTPFVLFGDADLTVTVDDPVRIRERPRRRAGTRGSGRTGGSGWTAGCRDWARIGRSRRLDVDLLIRSREFRNRGVH